MGRRVAAASSAQATKPLPLADLALYKGADREQALVSGAKKEGKVVWYTALAGIERGMTPEQLEKESARWEKALRELARK